MKQNLRTLLNFKEGYHKINREERNLAAIFYHTLLLKDNFKTFLHQINYEFPVIDNEMGIYFEYAYIRDLWKVADKNNKRKLILDLLQPNNRKILEKISIEQFNNYFGTAKPSKINIQSPSNWSIQHFNKKIEGNDEFLKVCKFKWTFNAKPDIVIHTAHNTAICIETKLESGEGKYPNNKKDKNIFKERGISSVGQLEIQRKIMELLGVSTKFIFLVQKKSKNSKGNIIELTWKEVFENQNIENCPYFIKSWIKRLGINKTSK